VLRGWLIAMGVATTACGSHAQTTARPVAPACPAGTTAQVVRPVCTAYEWRDDTCLRYEVFLCDPKYARQYSAKPGETASVCQRPDGVNEGPVRGWDERGRLRVSGQLVDGAPHGAWITWHENGRRLSATTYRHGLRHGPYLSWHENGQLWSEAEMRDGRPVGRIVIRNERGEIVRYKDLGRAGTGD